MHALHRQPWIELIDEKSYRHVRFVIHMLRNLMTQWRVNVKEQRIFSPDKIFTASKANRRNLWSFLRLQKFWWVQEIVRTRNGFAFTDFLANQIKLRVVRTGPNTLSFLLWFSFLRGILLARSSITTSQHTVVTKTRNDLQPSTTT